MNNFIDNLAEKLTPLAGKLGSNRYLAVLVTLLCFLSH